ncbi:chemotaxis protein CheW [Aliikangiella sp. IMCC44359]|uniref:chemotaxis protein CheW n=1 Tax=Aliikangiella sp. IMCC44359 TaxID=3459125 RepID=UPI00403A9F99
MKLNKPPVTEEQSILEEYVDFLLLDNSNVHPLKIKSSHHKNRQENNESNFAETRKKNVREAENNTNKEQITQKVKQDNSAKTSITQIIDDKRDTANIIEPVNILEDKNELEQPPPKSMISPKVADDNQETNKANINQANINQAESTITAVHEYVEESEEEQLKEWNALLSASEPLINAEKSVDEVKNFNDKVVAQPEVESQLIKEKKVLEKKYNKLEEKDVYQKSAAEQDEIKATEAISPKKNTTQQLIDEYLPAQKDERLAGVEKLLSRISLATIPTNAESEAAKTTQAIQKAEPIVESETTAEATQATFIQREVQRNKDILPDVFQTLIFQVAKLPLAVPLLKLGGISKITQEDITPLVGTPDWFMGLVPNERGNLMVIDTQKYLMPEQAANRDEIEYQYLIILDDSNWALACHGVGDAKNLTTDDIRWSEKTSKRPWFAGMVVEFMSALIEVDELINMLAKNIVE